MCIVIMCLYVTGKTDILCVGYFGLCLHVMYTLLSKHLANLNTHNKYTQKQSAV